MKRHNPEFVRGFARLVITKGYGAKAPPTQKDRNGQMIEETWQDVGRRIYGASVFNAVLKEELARRAPPVVPEGAP